MNQSSRPKLRINKAQVRVLSQEDRGTQIYMDSRITCDLECWWWSYFTRG